VRLAACVLGPRPLAMVSTRESPASAPHPPRRAAKELLQRLRPEEPAMLLGLCGCLAARDGPLATLEAIHDAITSARRQRSPYFEAFASYTLAVGASVRMQEAPPGTRLDAPWARPSAILECLRRGDGALQRCKGVLPTHWVAQLTDAKAAVDALRPWLERCQRRGDRLSAGAAPEVPLLLKDGPSHCSGCGEPSSQLRACPCKKARYCRWAGKARLCVCVRACVHPCILARATCIACTLRHTCTCTCGCTCLTGLHA
jgi:hypothetical protein